MDVSARPDLQAKGAKPGARDAEATRQRILAAAEREFARKGYAGARVDTIAEESGANKGMLYYYFDNKEELYIAVLERVYAAMRQSERDLAFEHLPPLDAIRTLVEFKFDYFAQNPSVIRLLTGENLQDAQFLKRSERLQDLQHSLVETLDRILKAGASEGMLREDIDPLQLYLSISGLSFFYFANAATLATSFGRDLASPDALAQRRAHVAEVILSYLKPVQPPEAA
jgi:AcrR family transcriptional regulator